MTEFLMNASCIVKVIQEIGVENFLKQKKLTKQDEVTYTLEDENTQRIEGNYYARELLERLFNFKFYNKTLETIETFH